MPNAIDRLEAEIDELAERITQRVFAEVPEYRDDTVAQVMLLPYTRLNLDEVMRALRGVETTPATARHVALADAIATGLSLDAVRSTFSVAHDVILARLHELADDGEGLDEPLARFAEAFAMVDQAISEEYLSTKDRIDPA